jgi:hypothetical protein
VINRGMRRGFGNIHIAAGAMGTNRLPLRRTEPKEHVRMAGFELKRMNTSYSFGLDVRGSEPLSATRSCAKTCGTELLEKVGIAHAEMVGYRCDACGTAL